MKKIFNFLNILLFIIIVLIILLTLSIFITRKYMESNSISKLYYDRGFDNIPESDYILVPGAKIEDGAVSLYLKNRLDYAIKLYEGKKAPKIIISGAYDDTEKSHEVDAMKEYLINMGVAEEDIISDYSGKNTYATLKRTKEFVNDKSVIFCTQEMFSYRAIYISDNLDLNMVVYCSDPYLYTNIGKNAIREMLAQEKAVLNCTIYAPKVDSIENEAFEDNGGK